MGITGTWAQSPPAATATNSPSLEERILRLEQKQATEAEFPVWKGFEFHGYLRSGFGVAGNGDPMEAFKAPNAGAKYRLGNEAETYLETVFRQALVPQASDTDFATQIRLAYYLPSSKNNAFDATLTLPEAFAEVTGVLAANPEAGFWAGQRFYDRWDIHMNDFYYRDMSGFGGGLQDFSCGGGKVALAWIGGTLSEVGGDGLPFEDPNAVFNKNTLDLRVYDLAVLGGKLGFSLDATRFNGDTYLPEGETETAELQSDSGFAGGVYYTLGAGTAWQNRLVALYGVGAAADFRSIIAPPKQLDVHGGDIIQIGEFERVRIINDFTVDTTGPWSLALAAVYDRSDLGQGDAGRVDWISVGARPVYFFTEHYSVAFETGWDYTDTEGGEQGSLWKFTVAPQLTPQSKIMSRPSLRLFMTYAVWSDEFEGLVAPIAYAEDTAGLSAGIQVETWW